MPNVVLEEEVQNGAVTETETAGILFLFAETLVHAGTGREEGVVDLPIQRSVQTGWPIVNDSTLHGSLKRQVKGKDEQEKYFGTADSPGKIATPDAEILLFPVAAANAGLTAWVTCIPALRYFLRQAALFEKMLSPTTTAGADKKGIPGAKEKLNELKAYVTTAGSGPADGKAWLAASSAVKWAEQQATIILESDAFATEGNGKADDIAKWMAENINPFDDYWKDRLQTHIVLLPEAAFTHYVQTKTDLRTRISISEGRASDKALWTEENLPVDTVMYAVCSGKSLLQYLKDIGIENKPVIQLGGDQNLGRGLMRVRQLGG